MDNLSNPWQSYPIKSDWCQSVLSWRSLSQNKSYIVNPAVQHQMVGAATSSSKLITLDSFTVETTIIPNFGRVLYFLTNDAHIRSYGAKGAILLSVLVCSTLATIPVNPKPSLSQEYIQSQTLSRKNVTMLVRRRSHMELETMPHSRLTNPAWWRNKKN